VDMEVRLWMELVVQCQLAIRREADHTEEGGRDVLGESMGSAQIQAFLTKTPATPGGGGRNQVCALFLKELPIDAPCGKGVDTSMIALIAKDPMALFYAAATLFRRGREGWLLAKGVTRGEVRRQVPVGHEAGGSWDPTGEFGARYGRSGMTAISVLIMQVHCGLGGLVMFTC
jgi:hypothetical protein